MATKKLATVDKLLDQLATLRLMHDEAAAAAKVAKDECDKLELELLNSLLDAGLETTGNQALLVSIKRTDVPTIKDSAAFDAYVLEHDALDLLQRRLSTSAWRARVEAGESIPGTEIFKKIDLAVRSR